MTAKQFSYRVFSRGIGKQGLTLLEILVSVIILAMLVAGLTQVFVSAKKFSIHSRSRMAAAQMGKVFLDNLQMHVRQDTWDVWNSTVKNDLVATSVTGLRYCDGTASTQQSDCPPSPEGRRLDNTTYDATYKISTDPAKFGLLRQVALNITWDENTPY